MVVPDNIMLLPLPPYSPYFDPLENVREYLRANKLSAGVWDRYDEIPQACAEAWNWLMKRPRPQTIYCHQIMDNGQCLVHCFHEATRITRLHRFCRSRRG